MGGVYAISEKKKQKNREGADWSRQSACEIILCMDLGGSVRQDNS
jgi:hypothetical protein